MIQWFNDKNLCIVFSSIPLIGIRYILPSMSIEEKKSIKKYPFINKIAIKVEITDRKNKKIMFLLYQRVIVLTGLQCPVFFGE